MFGFFLIGNEFKQAGGPLSRNWGSWCLLLQLLWYYHIIRLQFTNPSLKSIPWDTLCWNWSWSCFFPTLLFQENAILPSWLYITTQNLINDLKFWKMNLHLLTFENITDMIICTSLSRENISFFSRLGKRIFVYAILLIENVVLTKKKYVHSRYLFSLKRNLATLPI